MMNGALRLCHDNYGWLLVAGALFLLCAGNAFLAPMAVMAALGFYRICREPRALINEPWLRALLLLFLCLWLPQLASLPDAVNPARAARVALSYPLYLFCGVFIVWQLGQPRALARLSLAVLLIALFWCADALLQYAGGQNLLGYPRQPDGLTGMFHPRQRLGIVLAALVPIVLEVMRQRNNQKALSWLLLIPLAVVVFLSGRRSAWIMLLVGLSAYLPMVFISLSARARYTLVGAVCVVALLGSWVYLNSPDMHRRVASLPGIFSSAYLADRATSQRTLIWEMAWTVFRDNPINGVGPRGFRYVYQDGAAEPDQPSSRRLYDGQTHPHLLWLEVAAETGVLGLVGYLLFCLLALRYWWRGRSVTQVSAWTAALLSAAFPLNAHMALYGSYWSGYLWLLTACALAVMAATGVRPGPAVSRRAAGRLHTDAQTP